MVELLASKLQSSQGRASMILSSTHADKHMYGMPNETNGRQRIESDA